MKFMKSRQVIRRKQNTQRSIKLSNGIEFHLILESILDIFFQKKFVVFSISPNLKDDYAFYLKYLCFVLLLTH